MQKAKTKANASRHRAGTTDSHFDAYANFVRSRCSAHFFIRCPLIGYSSLSNSWQMNCAISLVIPC
ncbi:hypothetical protein T11_18080 [Trichinella zimbabwensis]|uniref:Uncharacterized protein n=1 Tax=Trichinella zimbabwensis TaxID=268475 RepID=A0A0V1H4Q4_9BILA|nr:hypothetical protein T11_18080 [Trichinella zimbabwensis]